MTITDYRGMSYPSASKEGMRLLEEAVKSGRWHHLPERLKQLREVMMGHIENGTSTRRPADKQIAWISHSARPRTFLIAARGRHELAAPSPHNAGASPLSRGRG